MDLIVRPPEPADLAGCFRVCYPAFGYPRGPMGSIAGELRRLWDHPATFARVVEDRERQPGDQERPQGGYVVGYWDAVFVTDAHACWARADMPPFVNRHLTPGPPCGSGALLNERAIAEALAGEGLTLLVTHWGWDTGLPDADRLRVQERLSREFFAALRGYNVREVLTEVVGHDLYRLAVGLGYRLRRGYGEDPGRRVEGEADLRPFLVGASREEAGLGEWISPAFVFTPPRLGFTARQRALLAWALRHGSDAGFGAAQEPALSAGGVKKRWDEVFARVERAQRAGGLPPLLPEAGVGTRGPERRRRLLEYLREHPEELRPATEPRPAARPPAARQGGEEKTRACRPRRDEDDGQAQPCRAEIP